MAEAAIGGGDQKGDTFLTDMLLQGNSKTGVKGTKKGKAVFQSGSKPNMVRSSAAGRKTPNKQSRDRTIVDEQTENISDLEDEYRDVVFDVEQSRNLRVEQSRALVQMADDYLDGKDEAPLAITGPMHDLEGFDDTKSFGGASRFSGVSGMTKMSERNYVDINKSAQGKMRPFLRQQRPTDRLAPD